MRKMMTALAALSACAALCGQARADEIYTFTTTSYGKTAFGETFALTLTYDLADAVVEAGSFNLRSAQNGGPPLSGDVSAFTALTFQERGSDYTDGETVTPTSIFGYLTTALTFNSAGDVSSSALNYGGVTTGADISGTGDTASGTAGTDAGGCYSGGCTVTGIWTHTGDPLPSPVPEPATFALLGAGLIGLAAAGHRRISSPA